mgnify:CR=1 FL=1
MLRQRLLWGSDYIQTTREVIPGVNYLFFSEEHSHATEQKLVKDDIDRAAAETDRIIFIEDEVTTGKNNSEYHQYYLTGNMTENLNIQ